MFAFTASASHTLNSASLYGRDLDVSITRRKVASGVRVRITVTRVNYQAGHFTQTSFRDFTSAEEAAGVFAAQAKRWHDYTQAA